VKSAMVVCTLALAALLLQPEALATPGRALHPFHWGVGTHLINMAEGPARLGFVSDVGAGAIRDDALWSRVEEHPGEYALPAEWPRFIAEARRRKIAPLLILDYGNPLYQIDGQPRGAAQVDAFANYARYLARRFKGSVPMYEVWNEWPMRTDDDVRDYIALLSATYRAVKQVDPQAVVLGGGFGVRGVDALSTFVDMGGLAHLDGISIHPYVHCERSPGPEGFMELVLRMTRATAKGPPRPLYITEAGWPTHAGRCGIPERDAARNLAESYLLARCLPRVAGFWWYDLTNDGLRADEMEHNFGLYAHDLRQKSAARIARAIGAIHPRLRCKRAIRFSRDDARYGLDGHTLTFDAAMERLWAPESVRMQE